MKIKIFESDSDVNHIETLINDWLDSKKEVVSTNVTVLVMNDYYNDSAPPMVCNTWYRYVATILYKQID